MENILMPAVGSNQHITKFDETKKRKKLKIKFATKVKIAVITLLLLSLYLNYYTIKTNYVFTCTASFDGIKQTWKLGHLMSKNTCEDLISDHIKAITGGSND